LAWGAAAVLTVAAAPFGARLAAFVPPCLFKTWTGIPCPLCGTTRAAVALGHLDIAEALRHYPLQSVFWVVMIGGGLFAGAVTLAGRPLPSPPSSWRRVGTIALALALALNWIYSIVTGV
jgi:hypothetical protein